MGHVYILGVSGLVEFRASSVYGLVYGRGSFVALGSSCLENISPNAAGQRAICSIAPVALSVFARGESYTKLVIVSYVL